jgi:hypothetical protein
MQIVLEIGGFGANRMRNRTHLELSRGVRGRMQAHSMNSLFQNFAVSPALTPLWTCATPDVFLGLQCRTPEKYSQCCGGSSQP